MIDKTVVGSSNELPSWDACADKRNSGQSLTALEEFIFDNEPVRNSRCSTEWEDFRAQLLAVLIEQRTAAETSDAFRWICIHCHAVCAQDHTYCHGCGKPRYPHGAVLKAAAKRHSSTCDCHDCHYAKKHPQVKPHHALCGCFECAPKAAVSPTEQCPAIEVPQHHRAHEGKCMYCEAPMPTKTEPTEPQP